MPTLALRETCCQHCGAPVNSGAAFCCAGCESVHALLVSRGLEHFYELRDRYSFRRPMPAQPALVPESHAAVSGSLRLYIEGIHCLGCLWLLEKLPEIDGRIRSSQLDFAHQILELDTNGISLREVLVLIQQLGYSAHAVQSMGQEPARFRDSRRQLVRIGVAAFGAGNIMLLSVATYAGTGPTLTSWFGWLSLALATPVLTFSAWPIYRAAFLPLLQRRFSVDLAIASALMAGTVMSLWSLITGTASQVYFDSLSMLVFLLLSSRFVLTKFRESLAKDSNFLHFLAGEKYSRAGGESVLASELKAGDEILLRDGQTLPVDAVLTSDKCHFDFSLLTGESLPLTVKRGDRVEAGAVLRDPEARLRAERPAATSRLALILEKIKTYQLQRSPTLDFADRLGKYFVGASLLGATLLCFAFPGAEGVRRALALIIVTCPCVLAFAVPLAFTRALQLAAKRGILFVAPSKLEALAGIRTIFLDKTGTITSGNFEVLEWRQRGEHGPEALEAALSLEADSAHPVGKAIARYALAQGASRKTAAWNAIPGYGVEGRLGTTPWRIGKSPVEQAGVNKVEILRNGRLETTITLGDSLREDSKEVAAALAGQGIQLRILSGDNAINVARIAAAAGIPEWDANLLPEDKARIVGATPTAAMVGDGANDAIAFQTASVGIAVQGAIDLGIQNCDVVLTRPGLRALLEAREISTRAMRVVSRNFAVTLSYNLLAGTLAAMGLMQPLWAAVIMPVSALSVFALTQWHLREEGR